jgi:hypothetical protein
LKKDEFIWKEKTEVYFLKSVALNMKEEKVALFALPFFFGPRTYILFTGEKKILSKKCFSFGENDHLC